jgi:hypothetical protein
MRHKILAGATLLTGLALSAIAAYYSVVGLTSIFPSENAYRAIVSLGFILEIAKLVAVSWLYHNWGYAAKTIKYSLSVLILAIMLITSMGIFGFLSNAHIEQTLKLSTGNSDRIESLNLKIQIKEEAIAAIDKKSENVDKVVDKLIESGRTKEALKNNKTGVDPEKIRLIDELIPLKEERIRLQSEQKKVEAEFGPIKYVAEFFVDNADAKVLDKAVSYVIILLILIFDPMAILLLLAFNISINRKDEYNIEFLDMGSKRRKRKET